MTDAWPPARRDSVGEGIVLSCAVLGLVASVLPWYSEGVSVFGFSASVSLNAWHAGVEAWLSILALVLAGVIVLVFGASVTRTASRWCWPTVAGLAVGAAACLGDAWTNWARHDDTGNQAMDGLSGHGLGWLLAMDAGPGIGFYLGVLATLVAGATAMYCIRMPG